MEWSFKKAITIQTYSTYHPVPVPFNLISSIWLLCERYILLKLCPGCIARCRGRDTDDEDYLKARVCYLASGNVSSPKKATGTDGPIFIGEINKSSTLMLWTALWAI